MPINYYMFFIVGLIPIIIGFIYYHEKVFGTGWMKVNGFTKESLEGGNMPLILGLSYLFSVMMAFILSSFVIHQGGAFSMMYPEILVSGSAEQALFNKLMVDYGDNSRSFLHGVIHGWMVTIFFVLPIIAINALFERRGWKYILFHVGYWAICLALMGGIICSTLKYAPLM